MSLYGIPNTSWLWFTYVFSRSGIIDNIGTLVFAAYLLKIQ